MPGPLYALSEALIVLAAFWAVPRLGRGGSWFAAAGLAIFGLAAAIGTYRFGFDRVEQLADFHRWFSQVGGAIAMSLVAFELALHAGLRGQSGWLRVAGLTVLASGIGVCLLPGASVPLFLGWLLVAIGAAATLPATASRQRVLRAALVAIFLFNLLLFRRSPYLDPAVSWHLFHLLVAVWLVGVACILTRRSLPET